MTKASFTGECRCIRRKEGSGVYSAAAKATFTALFFASQLLAEEAPEPVWGMLDDAFIEYDMAQIERMIECAQAEKVYSYDCLGCHDGVNARNVAVNTPTEEINGLAFGNELNLVAKDNSYLVGMHPVAIYYNEAKSDLNPAYTRLHGSWRNASTVSDLLVDGKVECSSCHALYLHGKTLKTLRNKNYKSELCVACHKK